MEDIPLCLKYSNKIYMYSVEHNNVFISGYQIRSL